MKLEQGQRMKRFARFGGVGGHGSVSDYASPLALWQG